MNICMRINMRTMLLGDVQRRTLFVSFVCVCVRVLFVFVHMFNCFTCECKYV